MGCVDWASITLQKPSGLLGSRQTAGGQACGRDGRRAGGRTGAGRQAGKCIIRRMCKVKPSNAPFWTGPCVPVTMPGGQALSCWAPWHGL